MLEYQARNLIIPTIAEDNTRMVVHHNPLPDITHEDFVSLLGPLLAPENYPAAGLTTGPSNLPLTSSASLSTFPVHSRSSTGSRPPTSPLLSNPNSPAPFDWLHFEGRTVKTTLNNITGLDGLARERKWRSHCVISIDVGRKGRQGVEAVCRIMLLLSYCMLNGGLFSSYRMPMYCFSTGNMHKPIQHITTLLPGHFYSQWHPRHPPTLYLLPTGAKREVQSFHCQQGNISKVQDGLKRTLRKRQP